MAIAGSTAIARAADNAPAPRVVAPSAAAPSTPVGKPAPAPVVLPPARSVDAILADIVSAVGGAAAMGRHRSLHTKMEIAFKGLGINGTAEHYGAVGDKALTITDIPNLASTREGSDGTRFWSQDPINGLRILEGAEAEQARIEVAWNAELRMKDLFTKIEAKNEAGENGTRLECLTLTPKAGTAMTDCFDAKTHLMAIQRGVRSGPQGEMPYTAHLGDWRTVGDVKMAFMTEMQVGPLSFTGRVTLAEMDVPIDAAMFAIPAVAKTDGQGGNAASGATKPKARPAKKASGDASAVPSPALPPANPKR
jgi:hypothetical protein